MHSGKGNRQMSALKLSQSAGRSLVNDSSNSTSNGISFATSSFLSLLRNINQNKIINNASIFSGKIDETVIGSQNPSSANFTSITSGGLGYGFDIKFYGNNNRGMFWNPNGLLQVNGKIAGDTALFIPQISAEDSLLINPSSAIFLGADVVQDSSKKYDFLLSSTKNLSISSIGSFDLQSYNAPLQIKAPAINIFGSSLLLDSNVAVHGENNATHLTAGVLTIGASMSRSSDIGIQLGSKFFLGTLKSKGKQMTQYLQSIGKETCLQITEGSLLTPSSDTVQVQYGELGNLESNILSANNIIYGVECIDYAENINNYTINLNVYFSKIYNIPIRQNTELILNDGLYDSQMKRIVYASHEDREVKNEFNGDTKLIIRGNFLGNGGRVTNIVFEIIGNNALLSFDKKLNCWIILDGNHFIY